MIPFLGKRLILSKVLSGWVYDLEDCRMERIAGKIASKTLAEEHAT
jgi:hypothetical protein